MGTIPAMPSGDVDAISDALLREGAVVIQGVTDPALREQLVAEIEPHMQAAEVATEVADEDF